MALATSSLPVPVSPWMRTTELVRATLCNESQTFRGPRLEPMSSLRADESEGMTLIALVTMYYSRWRSTKAYLCVLGWMDNFTSIHVASLDAWQLLQSRVECIIDFVDRELQN